MHTKYTNSKGSFVFVHVAPDARNCEVLQEQRECYEKGDLVYLTEENFWRTGNVILPPDNEYTFLFATNTATNEDAAKVVEEWVEGKEKMYENYEMEYPYHNGFLTPLESLSSLLHSLNIEGNCGVLEVK